MDRVDVAAFVETLDSDSAHALEVATREFYQAFSAERCCSKSRLTHWTHQLNAARERLIDILSDEPATQPLPRPLEDR